MVEGLSGVFYSLRLEINGTNKCVMKNTNCKRKKNTQLCVVVVALCCLFTFRANPETLRRKREPSAGETGKGIEKKIKIATAFGWIGHQVMGLLVNSARKGLKDPI